METASDKLDTLIGRVVRVEFTDGSHTSGKLTKVKRSPLLIDGVAMNLPHAIVLDYEDSFTHLLTSVAKLDLNAKVREKIVRVEQAPSEPLPAQRVQPVKRVVFDPSEFAGFEESD